MIYGNLRSTYSPTGKEYVTRWNPLMKAIGGIQDEQPKETTKVKAGEFGSGMASGAESGDAGDSSGGKGGGKGGQNYSGTSQDFGMPSLGGYGKGGTFSSIGSGLGLAAGIPGAGVLGNAVGTAMDTSRANEGLAQVGLPGIGFGGFMSGMLNNATFGLLGENIGSQWGAALNANSPYGNVDPQAGYDPGGMADPFGPGGTLADPYGGVDPNSGAQGGVGGSASNDFSGANNGEAGMGGYYSRGGHVNAKDLYGPDPVGPDDGYGGLDHGEFVLRAAAAEKLGPEVLEKLNSGDFRKAALVKALLGK